MAGTAVELVVEQAVEATVEATVEQTAEVLVEELVEVNLEADIEQVVEADLEVSSQRPTLGAMHEIDVVSRALLQFLKLGHNSDKVQ